jgi:hypothetical protein
MTRNERPLRALSHKALAKAEIFAQQSSPAFVLFGTSRTQDGVNPEIITRSISNLNPLITPVHGFNASYPGSTVSAFKYLSKNIYSKYKIKMVIVEVSKPQIENKSDGTEPWNDGAREHSVETIEEALKLSINQLAIFRHRHMFIMDNLSRIPAVFLFPKALTGWESRGVDQVLTALGRIERGAIGFDSRLWEGRQIPTQPRNHGWSSHAQDTLLNYENIVRTFHGEQAKVVFLCPPIYTHENSLSDAEVLEISHFLIELKARTGCQIWDYSSSPAPLQFFRDRSHLNRQGRAHFSTALAQRICETICIP